MIHFVFIFDSRKAVRFFCFPVASFDQNNVLAYLIWSYSVGWNNNILIKNKLGGTFSLHFIVLLNELVLSLLYHYFETCSCFSALKEERVT